MDTETIHALLELNRKFYAEFAAPFNATRAGVQPGVQRLAAGLQGTVQLMDVGCGNGTLVRWLIQQGCAGRYLGVDFSAGLLDAARAGTPGSSKLEVQFFAADLSKPGWSVDLPVREFTRVSCFAVLHHVPSMALRRMLLQEITGLILPGGMLYLSNWQFLHSARLVKRIQPWEMAGLDPRNLEIGDYLLDWRAGGQGLRYVHHFSAGELEALAKETGYRVLESFLSDGREGNLSLYQVWQKR